MYEQSRDSFGSAILQLSNNEIERVTSAREVKFRFCDIQKKASIHQLADP